MSVTGKTIVLDRDGVINKDSPHYIKNPDEWQAIPGSLQAIAELNRAGFLIAIATNQSGLARGLFDESQLSAIHEKFYRELEGLGGHVDGLFFCPHHPDDGCGCRKPGVGMLEQIENQFGCSLEGMPFVGDSLKDIQAALAYKMKPVLVRTGNGEFTARQLQATDRHRGITVCNDLAAAVKQELQG